MSPALLICASLILFIVTSRSSAAAETPEELTKALMASDPELADLIRTHPKMPLGWREDFWADALLRAPSYRGERWRVHDLRRPQPPSIQPPNGSCSRPRPSSAHVLLDERGPLGFSGGQVAVWRPAGGVITSSGTTPNRLPSRESFGDVDLHLEFRMPAPPMGEGQYRGNSGVFLMGLYEVQILDSFDNPTYADGAMGALYGQVPPRVIANRPPGWWQCLDIRFSAPVFQEEKVISPARVTVRVNGVEVQHDQAFRGPTGFASLSAYTPHAAKLPLTLQDHQDAGGVAFRNIWVLPKEDE